MSKPISFDEEFSFSDLSLVSDPAMDDALSGLRESAIDPDSIHISRMEVSVLRRWRHEQDVKSWKWWAPFATALVIGFLLAGLSLSLLQPAFSQDSEKGSVAWPEYQAEQPASRP